MATLSWLWGIFRHVPPQPPQKTKAEILEELKAKISLLELQRKDIIDCAHEQSFLGAEQSIRQLDEQIFAAEKEFESLS